MMSRNSENYSDTYGQPSRQANANDSNRNGMISSYSNLLPKACEDRYWSHNCTANVNSGNGDDNNNDIDSDFKYLRRRHHQKQFFKKILLHENLHRFAIYENLCQHCGYVCSGYCDQNSGNRSQSDETDYENIYENVCESCSLIYSGVSCEHCANRLPKKSPSIRQFNKFTELIGNLRQKIREKSPKGSTNCGQRPKIEIIHNVGAVYKTNKTFDFGEIVRLKSESCDASPYGKLRKSDDSLLVNRERCDDLRTKRTNSLTSDSDARFIQNQTQRDRASNTHLGVIPIYENVFIAAQPTTPTKTLALAETIYSSVPPSLTNALAGATKTIVTGAIIKRQNSGSINNDELHTQTDSLRNWMTSLRRLTHDYDDDDNDSATNRCVDCYVKCVPSKTFGCCEYIGDRRAMQRAYNNRVVDNDRLDLANKQRVEEFQLNFVENLVKRNANHLKTIPVKEFEPILVRLKENYLLGHGEYAAEMIAKATESDNDDGIRLCVEKAAPSESDCLPSKNACMDLVVARPSNATVRNPRFRAINIRQKHSKINGVFLSIGLNRLVLNYDKRLHAFYELIINDKQIQNKYQNEFEDDFNDIFIIFSKALTGQQQGPSEHEWQRRKLCDKSDSSVLKVASNRAMDAMPVESHVSDLRMEIRADGQAGKLLTTREMCEVTNYSSSADDETDFGVGIRDMVEESIYQPIWKFKTVGFARESYNSESNDYVNLSDCSESVDDVGEWELDDEFSFSTDGFVKDAVTSIRNFSVCVPTCDPYRSVCILYSLDSSKYNKIVYDYNGTGRSIWDESSRQNEYKIASNPSDVALVSGDGNEKSVFEPKKSNDSNMVSASVAAWKLSLKRVDLMEDEEDLVSRVGQLVAALHFAVINHSSPLAWLHCIDSDLLLFPDAARILFN